MPDPNAEQTFTRSKLDWNRRSSEQGKQWLALTRELLALRQQYIVPLLATAQGAGKVVKTAPGFVAVSWPFHAGTLSMALNIGEAAQPLPDLPGETICAWPDVATDLPQNAIIVRLASGEAH